MSMTAGALTSNTSALAEAKLMLAQFGLGLDALAQPITDLVKTGVTDANQIWLALEPTAEFQSIFPGIRDPNTKQLIMTPAEYMAYQKQIRSSAADLGIAQPTQAQIGSFVQQRKSATEVQTEFQAYDQLRNEPFIAQHFEEILGQPVGPEGLFALITGQAPDLQARYDKAVAAGVEPQQYAANMAVRGNGAFSADDVMTALQSSSVFPFDAGQPFVNQFDKATALARSVAANQAEFKAGGSAILPFGQKALQTTF